MVITLLLAACSGAATPSDDPSEQPASPAPSASSTPRPTPDETATDQPTPTVVPATAEPTSTATPDESAADGEFGADVFDDPDDCSHPSGAYRVAFPDAWWWNTDYEDPDIGPVAACRFFAPSSFDAFSATRRNAVPTGVAIWLDYAERGCFGFINPVLEEHELMIDGFTATVREFAQGQQGDAPPAYYQYIIQLTPEVACEDAASKAIVATTGVDMFGDYEDNKAMLDRMMETMEITLP